MEVEHIKKSLSKWSPAHSQRRPPRHASAVPNDGHREIKRPLRHRLILCVLFPLSFQVSVIIKFTAVSVQTWLCHQYLLNNRVQQQLWQDLSGTSSLFFFQKYEKNENFVARLIRIMPLCEHSWCLCHFSVHECVIFFCLFEDWNVGPPKRELFVFFLQSVPAVETLKLKWTFQDVLSTLGLHHRHTESSVVFLCGTLQASGRQQQYPSCFQETPLLCLTFWPFIIYSSFRRFNWEAH